ncbi:hypothetical protein AtNW77_Chr3g0194371 [Arabidopsis thaliana]
MHDFKIALPQLSEEDSFMLSLPDLLQLYTVKKGHTNGTFLLSPWKGF